MYRFLLPSFARSDRRDCGYYQFGASSYIVESQVDAGRKVVQFFFVLNFEHDLSLHTSDMPRLPCPCTIAIGLTPYTRNSRHKSLLREYGLAGSTRREKHVLVCDQHILSYRTVWFAAEARQGGGPVYRITQCGPSCARKKYAVAERSVKYAIIVSNRH